ncbi:response regulator [Paenibacillus allorhizosphaerae]|uniref:Transcriptional regulatory protein DegU n=1 Tax=Paenibacillus allorhizosphaerae TaxID=2849866 RepID=A0ABN7TU34_9BACL|nr:response regulator transcription factor [Paenibacillus allorhizosphaerae]CAG7655042.1 Transcriptional regulatory protein DegU [Paenibacillus allorhizosphaerae]
MIDILIADDHTLMRDGLQTILNLEEDMRVVASAGNGAEALALTEQHRPHLILMDIQMQGMNGIECTKQIKQHFPETVILILTTFAEDDYIVEALAGGATGFLLKDMPGDKLIQSVRDAVRGQFMLPSVIAAKLASRLISSTVDGRLRLDDVLNKTETIALSEKEKTIALLMLEGKSNREMAELLFLSEGTVKNYVSAIYAKIGTNDRNIAVMTLRALLGGKSNP